MLNRFFSVFSLISRIPIPFKFKFDTSRLDFYLPIVGVFPCIINFFCLNLVLHFTNELIAIVIMLAVQYFCFNLFHLDGLCDTADAFLGTHNKEKTLQILTDSRIGVYGTFAAFITLVLKIFLLYAILDSRSSYAMLWILYPVFGRFCSSLLAAISKPADESGLGVLAKDSKIIFSVFGFLCAMLICVGLMSVFFLNDIYTFDPINISTGLISIFTFFGIAVLLSFLIALFFDLLHKKRIGGYTGDALGASIEIGELLFLLLAVVYL
ncbi:MAG: adenosylcobinamide-GDP ribazoletransferase [Termitinemataceae bacterium]|nr:MAG: adenosylcobinamide-GDP ribazoletransferase [Termitinemataceae bacterium]